MMPLHWGKAPAWLFQRMVRLCRAVTEIVVTDYGAEELLRRFSDPVWFQSFGCVLGFDWHSSGVTTTVCGALKEAVKGQEENLGLYVCGGKGGASRKTPAEIDGILRAVQPGWRRAGEGEPAERQGRFGGLAGWVPDIPARLHRHDPGKLGSSAAGDEHRHALGEAVSLAVRGS